MPRPRKKKIELELDDSTDVICTGGYQPSPISRTIERGEYRKLGDAVVTQHPEFWSVAVPVTQLKEGKQGA